jgi:uroporphyrinogen decarboxylase
MTRRERVIAAIEHHEPDTVPYSVGYTIPERERIATYLQDPDFESKIGNHIKSAYFKGGITELPDRPGFFRDLFGVVWNRSGADKDIGTVDNIQLPEPDMKNYVFPELDTENLHQKYRALIELEDDVFKIGNIGFSMFERAWTLRGMENILVDMVLNPEFTEELLDGILSFNNKILDTALQYDFDGFMFGDDWGQQRGLIMGPEHWRRFIKPRMAELYGRVRSKGMYVFQHSCGDVSEIFDDLIEIGLDVYQTLQPEIYNLPEVKERYGNKLTFWGGISTQQFLPYASPDQVRQVTRETMNILGAGGGYIGGPTHSLPQDVPPENVIAMIETFKEGRSA